MSSHKSFVRKDRDDDDAPPGYPGNFRGECRSYGTHESKTNPDARLYRKGKTASERGYMGHTLSDNRHRVVANAVVTVADGFKEREAAKAMINDARQALEGSSSSITLAADQGDDAAEFIQACDETKVIPYVAQNKSGRNSAVPEAIAKNPELGPIAEEAKTH